MKVIGIREMKAHLSRYLRDVQAGEVVLVTDRGRVVAELRPPGTGTPPADSAIERALRRLAEWGGLLLGEPHDPAAYAPSPVTVPEGTVGEILRAERDEG